MPPDVTIEILLRDRFSRHFAHQFNLGSLTPSRSLLIMHAVLFCGPKHSLVVRATSAPIFGQRVFAYFLTGLVPQASTALRLTCFQALKYIYIYQFMQPYWAKRGEEKRDRFQRALEPTRSKQTVLHLFSRLLFFRFSRLQDMSSSSRTVAAAAGVPFLFSIDKLEANKQ